jgi:hypothetical protein
MNSFELDYTFIDEKVIIDRDYYNIKEEQFKQVTIQDRFALFIDVAMVLPTF